MLGVVIDVGLRDRRWVWDVEIAVGHGFPVFGSNLDLGMGFRRLVKFLLIWVIFCCDLLLVILLGMGLLEVEAGARG